MCYLMHILFCFFHSGYEVFITFKSSMRIIQFSFSSTCTCQSSDFAVWRADGNKYYIGWLWSVFAFNFYFIRTILVNHVICLKLCINSIFKRIFIAVCKYNKAIWNASHGLAKKCVLYVRSGSMLTVNTRLNTLQNWPLIFSYFCYCFWFWFMIWYCSQQQCFLMHT